MSLSSLTSGLYGGNFTSLASLGLTNTALAPVLAPGTQSIPATIVRQSPSLSAVNKAIIQNPAMVLDANGQYVVASPYSQVDLGGGSIMTFDQQTLDAMIKPVLDPSSSVTASSDGFAAFSGAQTRLLIEFPQAPKVNGASVDQLLKKQLVEATTITISVHRAKSQVRPFGYINPKGVARGSRTIAGTIVLTKFAAEVLYKFLQSCLMADVSKDTTYNKLDQLPPLNIIMMFTNEQGYISTQKLFGVELVTGGFVTGVNDIVLEDTITYLATDLSPMVPLNFNTFFSPATQTNASAQQQTVSGLWKQA